MAYVITTVAGGIFNLQVYCIEPFGKFLKDVFHLGF